MCVGEKIEDTLRNGSKTAMSSEEVKSHQITFALEKKTLFLPEAEGITIVKKKKKVLPKLTSLINLPRSALCLTFWLEKWGLREK